MTESLLSQWARWQSQVATWIVYPEERAKITAADMITLKQFLDVHRPRAEEKLS